jgi:hypothetical protein
MELEFDKEIDAILRRASHTGTPAASEHLDADVIAAFAENALPERARSRYTLHLADCDRCRKQLSQTIVITDKTVEKAAGLPVSAPAEVSIPWYKAIIRTPNLAIAMGGLILVFSGVLGFLLLQNNRNSQNATVSQISEQDTGAARPVFNDQAANMTPNSNASVADRTEQLSANTVAGSPFATPSTSSNTAGGTSDNDSIMKDAKVAAPAPVEEKSVTARQANELPKVAAAAPPPPPPAGVTIDGIAADLAKRDTETRQAERSDSSLAAKRKEMDAMRSRDLPPAAAKSGPTRSGPAQMQTNQNAGNAVQMSVTRSAGGRKFTNRDGAWYDTGYKGQATQNVRRGSDEFKKLDPGLRSIANGIDGVVVVVWKDKAYRIQ